MSKPHFEYDAGLETNVSKLFIKIVKIVISVRNCTLLVSLHKYNCLTLKIKQINK